MKKIAKVSAGLLWALPFMAFAQNVGNSGGGPNQVSVTYLTGLLTGAKTLLDNAVVVLVSLAVCWFIWNVIKYAIADEEEGKEKARSAMVWGIVAIAVIVSIWGLVAILQNIFGTGAGRDAGQVKTLIPNSLNL
jgi:hypothetical protein